MTRPCRNKNGDVKRWNESGSTYSINDRGGVQPLSTTSLGFRPPPQPTTLFLLSCPQPHVGKIKGPRASVWNKERETYEIRYDDIWEGDKETPCQNMMSSDVILSQKTNCNGAFVVNFWNTLWVYTIGKSIFGLIDKRATFIMPCTFNYLQQCETEDRGKHKWWGGLLQSTLFPTHLFLQYIWSLIMPPEYSMFAWS